LAIQQDKHKTHTFTYWIQFKREKKTKQAKREESKPRGGKTTSMLLLPSANVCRETFQ
jgi:hypothetical protein